MATSVHFSRSQVLVDGDGTPLPSQAPTEGVRIAQEIHLPSLSNEADSEQHKPSISQTVEVLTHVDPRSHVLAWRLSSPAHWLFVSERWHILRTRSATDHDPEGRSGAVDFWRGRSRTNWREEETVYETWEVFSGVMAPAVSWFARARLERGLLESAYALKARLEKPGGWTWG